MTTDAPQAALASWTSTDKPTAVATILDIAMKAVPVRLFVVDATGKSRSELAAGDRPTVRLAVSDLQRAQRGRARILADRGDVDVVLDVTVAVARDFRSVRDSMAATTAPCVTPGRSTGWPGWDTTSCSGWRFGVGSRPDRRETHAARALVGANSVLDMN